MAHIIGTSGAWKAVCMELHRVGFHPEKISEIPNLIKTAKEEYKSMEDKSTKEVDDQINSVKIASTKLEANFEGDIKEYRERISKDIELAQIALKLLQEDVSLIQRLLNYFNIRTAKVKLRLLRNQHSNCPKKFQEKISLAKKGFEETQKNRKTLIENKCRAQKYKVELLERICSSSDLAGATAELELIESLKTLPDNYYVVNDVRIELNKAMYFDNEWLSQRKSIISLLVHREYLSLKRKIGVKHLRNKVVTLVHTNK